MEKFAIDEILAKVDELVEIIKNSQEYVNYSKITYKLKSNEEIMRIIGEVKELQKECVNLEYRKMDTSLVERKIEENLNYLKGIPIYSEYLYLEEELDELFQNVKYIIESHINNKNNNNF